MPPCLLNAKIPTEDMQRLDSRTLQSASILYNWERKCCGPSTSCNLGNLVVGISGTAQTGNKYTSTLTYEAYPFPDGLTDGKHRCDSGGIICWSMTKSSDERGTACVYYANDQTCMDFTAAFGEDCYSGPEQVVIWTAV